MINLFINSSARYAGKTLIAMGLALRMRRDGLKVGFLKTLGNRPVHQGGITTDQDALFMKELLGLADPLEYLCPIVLTQDIIQEAYYGTLPDLKERLRHVLEYFQRDRDVLLISGPGSILEGGFLGISALDLLDLFSPSVLLVEGYVTELEVMDFFLFCKRLLGEALLGTILNRVPPLKLDYVREKVLPFLVRRGIPVFGLLPEDKVLGSVSIGRLAELLGGKVLSGQEHLGQSVGDFAVGAMGVERALRYFRRLKDPAIITSGDRVDIQLAAMETGASCLILTEGFSPKDEILHKAHSEGIPLILVEDETIMVVEKVDTILKGVELKEEEKISRALELLEERINFSLLYQRLNIRL